MPTIKITEIQETNFGEKAVIESPFEAKDYIKHLPWKEYSEELKEHGTLLAKAESRGGSLDSNAVEALDAIEQFDFSDDFQTHVSWDAHALGQGQGAWTIDVEAVPEASKFWEFAGFTVEVADGVDFQSTLA